MEVKLSKSLREEIARQTSRLFCSILTPICLLAHPPNKVFTFSRFQRLLRNVSRPDSLVFPTVISKRRPKWKTLSKGKSHNYIVVYFISFFRLGFMKVVNKYWDSDLCLSKIKVNEDKKTIGFDIKNNRLAIVTNDRTIYFVDLPKEQARYIEEAEVRFYWRP